MTNLRLLLRSSALLLILLAPQGQTASAQSLPTTSPTTQASVRVTVRDMSGVIPGASVTLVRSDAPLVTVARGVTDTTGQAAIPGVAPGTYDIRVTF